jgi:ribonuclease BN (tRNA processing enzyme)
VGHLCDYARLVKITVLGGCGAWRAAGQAWMLADSFALREFTAGHRLEIGPFQVDTWALPHFVPNAGIRLTVDDQVLAYTGDTGPSDDIAVMARGADVLLAEATFTDRVLPARDAAFLSTARQAGEHAARADARRLVLTHLWPGTDPAAARAAAQRAYVADLDVATPGLTLNLG